MFIPVAGWRTFTSTCALFGDLKIQGVSSSGALLVAAEYDLVSSENASSNDAAHRYDGVDETNLALLPPRGESAAGAQWGSRFSMGGGLSSAQLLPTLMTMDPNDPRNAMLSSSHPFSGASRIAETNMKELAILHSVTNAGLNQAMQ